MLTITPIGSCRIATPLRLARQSDGFCINMNRIFGYSHSCAEAVQQMHFLHRDYVPSQAVWPLISRRDRMDERFLRPHPPSDVYVVEISSSKILTIGSEVIQLNYLKRRFADFFADLDRVRTFHRFAVGSNGKAMADWLTLVWSDTQKRRAEADLLRHIRIESSSQARLEQDMHTLSEGLGEVLFVTHVDARLPDGTPVPGRGALIERLRQAGQALGLPVYDPTGLMQQLGQSTALEDHSTALAHFTDLFSAAVLDQWYEVALHEMIERLVLADPDPAIDRIIRPHVRAVLAGGNTARLSNLALLLDALESEFAGNATLKLLQLEHAFARGSAVGIKRCFFQAAMRADLHDVPGLSAHLARQSESRTWLAELSEATTLSSGARSWMADFASARGWRDIAKALVRGTPPPHQPVRQLEPEGAFHEPTG